MVIGNDILEKTCKDMIENILFCLGDARKGTIYRVGQMPKLQAVRITSGARDRGFRTDPVGSSGDLGLQFPGQDLGTLP